MYNYSEVTFGSDFWYNNSQFQGIRDFFTKKKSKRRNLEKSSFPPFFDFLHFFYSLDFFTVFLIFGIFMGLSKSRGFFGIEIFCENPMRFEIPELGLFRGMVYTSQAIQKPKSVNIRIDNILCVFVIIRIDRLYTIYVQ